MSSKTYVRDVLKHPPNFIAPAVENAALKGRLNYPLPKPISPCGKPRPRIFWTMLMFRAKQGRGPVNFERVMHLKKSQRAVVGLKIPRPRRVLL